MLVLELGGNDGLRGIPPEATKSNLPLPRLRRMPKIAAARRRIYGEPKSSSAKHLDGEKAGDCCDPLTILARVASDASCRRNRRNNALDYDARRW